VFILTFVITLREMLRDASAIRSTKFSRCGPRIGGRGVLAWLYAIPSNVSPVDRAELIGERVPTIY